MIEPLNSQIERCIVLWNKEATDDTGVVSREGAPTLHGLVGPLSARRERRAAFLRAP